MKFRRKYLRIVKKNFLERKFKLLIRQFLNTSLMPLSVVTKRCFNAPILCGLMVTYRCNLDCLFCKLPQRFIGSEFDEYQMKKIITDFCRLGGAAVGFSGGEPLLRKDIFNLVAYAKDSGLAATLTTNGTLLNDESSERLMDSGLDELGISLDSHNSKVHDEIRGINKCWEQVTRGIETFIKTRDKKHARTEITVSFVLNNKNIDSVDDFISFCNGIGIDNISFGLIQDEFAEADMSISDIGKLSNISEILQRYAKEGVMIDNSIRYLEAMKNGFRNNLECWAGFQSLFVDCYGSIFPCYYYMEKNWGVNNTENISLKELWKSKNYQSLRKKLLKCNSCSFICHMELNALFNMYKHLIFS